jgi:release factor glutamine methyltransferase
MTFAQAHQLTRQRLLDAQYDVAEAQASARLLLDGIAQLRHAHLIQPQQELTLQQSAQLQQRLAEMERGKPLAYALGAREFYGLSFRCDERALIPRPETELLVEHALREAALRKAAAHNQSTLRLADLGTGTGCIAIALATHLPDAELFATDASPRALELARENAQIHRVENRVHFVKGEAGNWASPLLPYKESFDVIVSNPPYIAPRDIENLQTQIKDYEPRSALDGGEDGLDCYRQIAAQCGVLIKPGGALFCELGANQFDEVREIFERHSWKVEAQIFDFAGFARVLIARLK